MLAIDPYVTTNIQQQQLQNQQLQQQVRSQNMLRQVLSQPGAVDTQGKISPNALRQIMQADAVTALGLLQQQTQLQDAQSLRAYRQSETVREQRKDDLAEISEATAVYNQEVGSGTTSPDIAREHMQTRLQDYAKTRSGSQQDNDNWYKQASSMSPGALQVMAQAGEAQGAQAEPQFGTMVTPEGRVPVLVQGGTVMDPNTRQPMKVTGPIEKEGTPYGQERLDLAKRAEALREKVAAGGAGALSNDDKDFAAQMYLDTGQMPNMGYGQAGAAARSQILHRAAEISGQDYGSPRAGADAVAMRKQVMAADRSALTYAERSQTSIEQNAPTALKMLDGIDRLMKVVSMKGGPDALNQRYVDFEAKWAGDPDAREYLGYIAELGPEYGKIMAGATGSVAQTSDAAMSRVDQVISSNEPVSAMVGSLRGIRNGIEWRRENAAQAVQEARDRMRTDVEPGDNKPPGPPAPPGSAYKSAQDVVSAFHAKKLTRDEAAKILRENGWAQ
jgi:hypothetical protein